MIGLDTNVLLRLGDEQDPSQRARAIALLHTQGQAGSYVNPIVLSEFAWTLGRRYKLARDDVDARLAIVL